MSNFHNSKYSIQERRAVSKGKELNPLRLYDVNKPYWSDATCHDENSFTQSNQDELHRTKSELETNQNVRSSVDPVNERSSPPTEMNKASSSRNHIPNSSKTYRNDRKKVKNDSTNNKINFNFPKIIIWNKKNAATTEISVPSNVNNDRNNRQNSGISINSNQNNNDITDQNASSSKKECLRPMILPQPPINGVPQYPRIIAEESLSSASAQPVMSTLTKTTPMSKNTLVPASTSNGHEYLPNTSKEIELQHKINQLPITPGGSYYWPWNKKAPSVTKRCIPDIEKIFQTPFYWGNISSEEAHALLRNKRNGCFLLRDSAQKDTVFTISYMKNVGMLEHKGQVTANNRIFDVRIRERGRKFYFESTGVEKSAQTVLELTSLFKVESLFHIPYLRYPLKRKTPLQLKEITGATVARHFGNAFLLENSGLPEKIIERLSKYFYLHQSETSPGGKGPAIPTPRLNEHMRSIWQHQR